MQRLAQQRQATLQLTIYVGDDPVDAGGLPQVTVRSLLDEAIVVQGAAVDVAGVGIYEFPLTPANTTTLRPLVAEWVATVSGVAGQLFRTYHEVVGGHLFPIADLRRLKPFEDQVKYTDADLAVARDLATYALEDACNTAFVRRRRRQSIDDHIPRSAVVLERTRDVELATVSVDGGALEATAVSDLVVGKGGFINRRGGGFGRKAVFEYEYGWMAPPSPVVRAAKILAKSWLISERDSAIPSRATSMQTGDVTYQLVTAGMRGLIFDLPDVNAVVQTYAE